MIIDRHAVGYFVVERGENALAGMKIFRHVEKCDLRGELLFL
jgi:hypothetical protein